MNSDAEPNDACVLVVDDKPEDLRLIADYLAEHNFELMMVPSGAQALANLEVSLPDLILLDVDMPAMDGFEVCRRLKDNPATADIPVIFMTSFRDSQHKVEGLKLGAVDYITKPVHKAELLARIQTHLKLSSLQRSLVVKNTLLEEQNAELDAYAHTIAHSLKTPLAASVRFLEILSKYKADGLSKEQHQLARQALETLENSGGTVDALLLLSTIPQAQVERKPVDMEKLVEEALRQLARQRSSAQARVHMPKTWLPAVGYAPWVGQVWLNYLSNAFRYCKPPVELELGSSDNGSDSVRFWLRDNGIPLTKEERERLFVPFSRLRRDQSAGHGLGLTIVRRIVDKLGGIAGIDLPDAGGNCFFFTLPAVRDLSIK